MSIYNNPARRRRQSPHSFQAPAPPEASVQSCRENSSRRSLSPHSSRDERPAGPRRRSRPRRGRRPARHPDSEAVAVSEGAAAAQGGDTTPDAIPSSASREPWRSDPLQLQLQLQVQAIPSESPPMVDPQPLVVDWSNLPADILNIIQVELEFPDLFRSAAVCTSWRAAAKSLRRHGLYSRPQTPCLLYSTVGSSARAAQLYSLADKSTYTVLLPDPPIAERSIVGSSHGWLVTADARSELHLLNPATGEQLMLLPVATIEQVSPVFDDSGDLQRYDLSFYDAELPRKEYEPPQPYAVDWLRRVLYLKVVLSCDPSWGDCILMMIHNPYRQLSFARVGSNKWHWITTSFRESRYSDVIYHDGAFYAMNLLGGVHRYTIDGSCATQNIIFKDTFAPAYNMYIARTSSGDVLQISRITRCPIEDSIETHTTGFEIYKLDFAKQDTLDMDNLKDDALFIGHNYSYCLSTKDYPNLLPNHVYFTDDDEYSLMDDQDYRWDVGMYNLEDQSVIEIVSSQQWLNWPIPIWITPSFTKINL